MGCLRGTLSLFDLNAFSLQVHSVLKSLKSHIIAIRSQLPGVPASFDQEFNQKSLNVTKGEKTRESLFTF